MRRRLFIATVLVAALLIIGLTNHLRQRVGHSAETLPPLLFGRDWDIWIIQGGNQKRLIRYGRYPSWSQDREKFAFMRGFDIWVASANGRHQKQLTHFTSKPAGAEADLLAQITWHPKAAIIAFDRADHYHVTRVGRAAGEGSVWGDVREDLDISNIYLYPLKEARFRQIPLLWLSNETTGLEERALFTSSCPAFSPDGQKIAFARNGDLWLSRVEKIEEAGGGGWQGWNAWRFAAVAVYDGRPGASIETAGISHISWSGDGKWLAYDRRRLFGSGGYEEIWIIKLANPSIRKRIAFGIYPSFDPSGRWVAYMSQAWNSKKEAMTWGIKRVSVDGKEDKWLDHDAQEPAW